MMTFRKASFTLIMIGVSSLAFRASGFCAQDGVQILETAIPVSSRIPRIMLELIPDPTPKAAAVSTDLDPSQFVIDQGHYSLSLSPLGAPFDEVLFDGSLGVLVVLNVGDFISTNAALKYASLSELNPVSRLLMKNSTVFAVFKIAFTAFSYWGIKSLYKKKKTLAWFLSAAANGVFSYVVFSNLNLIRRARN